MKTVKNQVTTSKVAFIFSCPGNKEYECGYVCAGPTGRNLEKLLVFLSGKSVYFPTSDRNYYTIVNSSSIVHSKKETGNTEASIQEIENNIPTLKQDLKNAEVVICMGDKAKKAFDIISSKESIFHTIKRVNSVHLSPLSINTRNLDIEKDIATPILEALSK